MQPEKDSDQLLAQKREEFRNYLAAIEHPSLSEWILDGAGALIQRLTGGQRVPAWFSGLSIALATLALSFLISLLLGESYPARRAMITWEFWGCACAFYVMLVVRYGMRKTLTTFRESTIDALISIQGLDALQQWVVASCSLKRQVAFSLLFTLFWIPLMVCFFSVKLGGFLGVGATILTTINTFLMANILYWVMPYLRLPLILGQQHYKVYAFDPSSSDFIQQTSDTFESVAFLDSIEVAFFSLCFIPSRGGAPFVRIISVFWLLMSWGLIGGFFLGAQVQLGKVIGRAKQETLRGIQARVEALYAGMENPDRDTLATIEKLMELHDRVKATNNHPVSFRESLRFLNSLLLPLLGFTLANMDLFGQFLRGLFD
ncbi:MAG: hypothetical protein GTN71_01875 [Anaerolineae bacterium]|nr:hypothetical protein [Anaerolineae bacterium]